jgi:hypothetical protein
MSRAAHRPVMDDARQLYGRHPLTSQCWRAWALGSKRPNGTGRVQKRPLTAYNGDKLVLCMDMDTQYFSNLSLIKTAEIMSMLLVIDEDRALPEHDGQSQQKHDDKLGIP